MITTFHGLPEHGLPLVTQGHPDFDSNLADISIRGFAHPEKIAGSETAILRNETGVHVLALMLVWTYEGLHPRRHTIGANFGSSSLINALLGQQGAGADQFHTIAPGSKRIVTPEGIYGDNSDVLALPGRVGGMGFSSSRGRSLGEAAPESADCVLDFVLLEDGRCAGPDTSGVFNSLTSEVQDIRALSRQMQQTLRAPASRGALFEVLRPYLKHRRRIPGSPLMMTYSRMILDRVIEEDDDEPLGAEFDRVSNSPGLPLRRI